MQEFSFRVYVCNLEIGNKTNCLILSISKMIDNLPNHSAIIRDDIKIRIGN